jgi:DNA-binding GntR family transcriptional regulator
MRSGGNSQEGESSSDPGRAAFEPRRRGGLKKRAYEEIKSLILSEELPSGSFLSERKLSELLGMSKTPIRNALELLEAEGLVVVSPQQGIVVREISFYEIVDLFDIRIALESFVARNLPGTLTPEQKKLLEENLQNQADSAKVGDVVAGTKLDARFHLMLCEFWGNQEIVRVMLSMSDKLHRVILRVTRNDPGRLKTSYEEHASVAQAVLAGDGDSASQRMVEHLEYGKRFLVARRPAPPKK